MQTHIAQRLASRADVLTVVPPALPKLLSALSEPNLDIREVSILLGQYPSIAAKIIGAANSAWAAPAKPITDLFRACASLGLNFVLALASGLSIGSRRLPSPSSFDSRSHWLVAFTASRVTVAVSKLASWRGTDSNATSTSGLLHNLGILPLLHAMPKETELALQACEKDQLPLGQCLLTHTGVGLGEAGAFLAGRWSLPDALLVPVEHHENPDYKGPDEVGVLTVGFAAHLAETMAMGLPFSPTNPWATRLNLTQAEALMFWEEASDEREKLTTLAKALFGARP